MIYLLHFEPRYKHAGHYLGYCQYFTKRFEAHVSGNGSPLVLAAINAGCKVTLVRSWEGDGNAEQELKRVVGSRARLCPICNPSAMERMKVYTSRSHVKDSGTL